MRTQSLCRRQISLDAMEQDSGRAYNTSERPTINIVRKWKRWSKLGQTNKDARQGDAARSSLELWMRAESCNSLLVPAVVQRLSSGVLKASLATLAMLLVAYSGCCADAGSKELDQEFLRGYMAGEYELIGRKADSTATYTGHVTLRDEGGILQVTRTIEGKTDKCAARFDTVAGADRIPVLRMHFRFDGKEYDATYRWQSDPDNYPRFTGYVYLTGTKSPGLEALFPIHQ